MSPAVEDTLLQVADEFVMRVTHSGCLLAQHRNSSTLTTQDVRLLLEKVLGRSMLVLTVLSGVNVQRHSAFCLLATIADFIILFSWQELLCAIGSPHRRRLFIMALPPVLLVALAAESPRTCGVVRGLPLSVKQPLHAEPARNVAPGR